MAKFRKKPVVIEAFQLTWETTTGQHPVPTWFIEAMNEKKVSVGYTEKIHNTQWAKIQTLEGEMTANPNDWIICGVNGEIYPCKPDIFEKTYEKVE